MYYIENRPADSYNRQELYDIIHRYLKLKQASVNQERKTMEAYCMARNALDRISECISLSRVCNIPLIVDTAIKHTDEIMAKQLELF